MSDLEKVIFTLEKSVEKNGPNLPMTNSWLLAILKIAAGHNKKLLTKSELAYLQYKEAEDEWFWK